MLFTVTDAYLAQAGKPTIQEIVTSAVDFQGGSQARTISTFILQGTKICPVCNDTLSIQQNSTGGWSLVCKHRVCPLDELHGIDGPDRRTLLNITPAYQVGDGLYIDFAGSPHNELSFNLAEPGRFDIEIDNWIYRLTGTDKWFAEDKIKRESDIVHVEVHVSKEIHN